MNKSVTKFNRKDDADELTEVLGIKFDLLMLIGGLDLTRKVIKDE